MTKNVIPIEKQSFLSKILGGYAKWVSGRTFPNSKDMFLKLMEEKRVENEQSYLLPRRFQKKYEIVKETFNDVDVYVINGEGKQQILFLHGGGYVFQPEDYHWNWIGHLSKKINAKTVVPIYPKSPNHPFKEAFERIVPVYLNMLKTTDSSNINMIGDSAGGGFSLALAQLLKEKGIPQPANIILLYPWLDITMSNPEIKKVEDKAILSKYGLVKMGEAWAGDFNQNHYLLSPINGEISGLGKISLFIGEYDLFTPDARKFRDKALKQGIEVDYYEYPKMLHLFVMFPTSEGKKATEQIIRVITRR